MTNNETTSRRRFLKHVALGAALIPLASRAGLIDSTAAAQTVPNVPLDPKEPMPAQMGYVEDNTTVDKAKWPKKAGPDGDKQMCKNCVLYLEGGKKLEGKAGEWGRCGLFQTGLVNANGWCNSFAPKVAVS